MRPIGLHLRLYNSLTAVIEKAVRLEVPIFQCFMVSQETGKLFYIQSDDQQKFLELRKHYFKDLFLHGSYVINCASVHDQEHFRLQKEATLASNLSFTHLVLHPGSAKGGRRKSEGIQALARLINGTQKNYPDLKILLENTAHAGLAIGSDLHDFKELLSLVESPDALLFCIDTAHAFAYGYDITTEQSLEQFISLLDATISIARIALLHINDTSQKLGSKMDRHVVLGQGIIGIDALRNFVLHPRLVHIPLILELPEISEEEEKKIIQTVKEWHLEK